jgi:hypothetical protein
VNNYHYADVPVHLCSASEQFNFQQAYGSMVGGVLQMTINNYKQINGFSNFYWGWGQEDDDMYARVSKVWTNLQRLPARDGNHTSFMFSFILTVSFVESPPIQVVIKPKLINVSKIWM